MPGRKRRRRALKPEDVLTDRVRVDAPDLARLIRSVNPTPHALPRREAAARYRTKSQLQSHLILRFPSQVTVVADPSTPGAISLRVGPTGVDACHAIVDELEPEAAAWVRFALDTAPEPGNESPAGAAQPEPDSPGGPLAAARRALETWDYDAARTHFEAAWEASAGDPLVAADLLELYVWTLADYAAAIELGERMTARAAAATGAPRVRGLVALAAVHLGRLEDAARWLDGASGKAAVDALGALTRSALERHRAADAQRWLGRLLDADPSHPERGRLKSALAELLRAGREAAQEEAERRLMALAETALPDACESAAREVQRDWPRSEVASRLLEDVERFRAQRRLARRIIAASHAQDDERWSDALRLRSEAIRLAVEARARFGDDLELPATADELRQGLAETERRAREAEVAGAAADILVSLDGEDLVDVLVAWGRAGQTARDRALAARDDPRLDLAVAARSSFDRDAAQRFVKGLRALESARQEAAEHPRRWLSRLERYRSVLHGLEGYQALVIELRQAAEAQERARLEGHLRAATAALEAEDVAAARAALAEAADLASEEPDIQARLGALRARHERAVARALRERRVADAVAAGELTWARDLTRRYASDDAALWAHRLGELDARLEATFELNVLTEPPADRVGPDCDVIPRAHDPCTWFQSDGRVILVRGLHDCLTFQRLAPDLRTVLELVTVRVPVPFRPLITYVTDSLVWVAGHDGVAIAIDPQRWVVRHWVDWRPHMHPDEHLGRFIVAPGGRYLWGLFRRHRGEGGAPLRVLDLADRAVTELGVVKVFSLLSTDPAVFWTADPKSGFRLRDARGHVTRRFRPRAPQHRVAYALTPHPSIEGAWLMASPEAQGRRGGRVPFGFNAVDATTGEAALQVVVSDTDAAYVTQVASRPDSKLLWLCYQEHGGAQKLTWLTFADDALKVVDTEQLGSASTLAADANGICRALVSEGPDGVVLGLLDEPGPYSHRASDPSHARASFGRRLWRECVGAAGSLMTTTTGDPRRGGLVTRGPMARPKLEGPAVDLQRMAEEGRWAELRALEPELLARDAALPISMHTHHLLALAHLDIGDTAAARSASRRAHACGAGVCSLRSLDDLIAAMDDSLGDAPLPQTHTVARLARVIRQAEGATLAEAIDLLDRPFVHFSLDLQATARLAAAWLDMPPATSPAERYRQRRAVCGFLEALHRDRIGVRRFVAVGGNPWGRPRLEALERRALAWLRAGDAPTPQGR